MHRRPMGREHYQPLRTWERVGVVALLLMVVAFGFVTLWRSAYLDQRRTDADVYFRAAWALRTGQDPYAVAETNRWTYLYPPPLAVLVMPLAQEPPGGAVPVEQQLRWRVSYPAAVVVWYVLSAVVFILSVHWMALALEAASPHAGVRSARFRTRRWWVNRVLPALLCMVAAGSTIVRGQVNILLLACVCGACLLIARGRLFAAGAALAGPICVKLFPAFLLLYAVLTKSVRMMAGCLSGCVLLMAVIPVVVLGPSRTGQVTLAFVDTMLRPALGLGGSSAKQRELAAAFNNQSLLAVIHNWRDWHGATVVRKIVPSDTDKAWFLAVAAALVAWVVFAAWRAGVWSGRATLRSRILLLAILASLMLPLSPVCHNHYFVLHMPLLACLGAMAQDRARSTDMSAAAWLGVGGYFVLSLLPRLPGLDVVLKPLGVQMVVGLALIAIGTVKLAGQDQSPPGISQN